MEETFKINQDSLNFECRLHGANTEPRPISNANTLKTSVIVEFFDHN
jgi:hypothetical protein